MSSPGYLGEGPQRNLTEREAAHDWILALDADERLDADMSGDHTDAPLDDPGTAHAFNRKSYVGPTGSAAPASIRTS